MAHRQMIDAIRKRRTNKKINEMTEKLISLTMLKLATIIPESINSIEYKIFRFLGRLEFKNSNQIEHNTYFVYA